jgi:uncharacterized protein
LAWVKSQDMQIGDSQPGVPELRADARYNQDARLIADRFSLGTDLISIIAETVPEACTESYAVMEAIDRFAWQMRQRRRACSRSSRCRWWPRSSMPAGTRATCAGEVLPRNQFIMRQNLQNIETGTGLLNRGLQRHADHGVHRGPQGRDHQSGWSEVRELRGEIFVEGLDFRPGEVLGGLLAQEGEGVRTRACVFRLATGNVGVMAATNEEVGRHRRRCFYVYRPSSFCA